MVKYGLYIESVRHEPGPHISLKTADPLGNSQSFAQFILHFTAPPDPVDPLNQRSVIFAFPLEDEYVTLVQPYFDENEGGHASGVVAANILIG